jgi:hypothetical protein
MLSVLVAFCLSAPPAQIILPAPNKSAGIPYAQALAIRHSERNFATTPLPIQHVADVLWSVNGINRPESGLLTNPTAINAQDMTVYAVFADGAYLFDRQANVLNLTYTGDLRPLIASVQPSIADAPLILLMVSEYTKFTGVDTTEQKHLSALDAGIATWSALIWATANGYLCVPRGYMETAQVSAALNLTDSQILHLNVPIGLPPS